MTAFSESYIQLPDDSANTGKKIRTQSRVVGDNTVHVHNFIPISSVLIKGIYYATSETITPTTSTQNGTSTGVWWFQLPVNATVNARIRKIELQATNAVAGLVSQLTAPRISVTRMTHNGNWSGSTVSIAKRKTSDASNQSDIRTAMTGTVVSLSTAWLTLLVPSLDIATSGVASLAFNQFWQPTSEDEFLDIAPGEGLAIYQLTAGASTEKRRYILNMVWDEYDNT